MPNKTDSLGSGLTETQVSQLSKKHGPNEIPKEKRATLIERYARVLLEPMVLFLVITVGIYLAIGDLTEGLLLSISVVVVIAISLYQERKSEKAMAALRELASPRAFVIREGKEKRIAAIEVVPGDLIVLREGDRIPADGILLQTRHLNVDESLLTGESFPVRKQMFSEEWSEEIFDDLKSHFKVFSSTLVISGTAVMVAVRTGAHTEVGKIGKNLSEMAFDKLNLNKEIRQMVVLFAWTGFFVCAAIVLTYGLKNGQWVDASLMGLATAMSLLPEEFPVVLSVFMAMGAWRLSRLQVLIRNPQAIERLGAITTLCVDKTGTLTLNQMSVAQLANLTDSFSVTAGTAPLIPESFHEIAEYGVLASHTDPFDPMEKAIRRLLEGQSWGKEHLHKDWELLRDYPLSEKLLAMSCVWKNKTRAGDYIVASKGAPEAVIELCHLPQAQSQGIQKAVHEMARAGLRVLGVAKASFSETLLPEDQHAFAFQWVGLIGLEDPIRAEVPQAVQICRDAGIRVIMMTGDYPETAKKIGQQAGLALVENGITGSDLESLTDQDLIEKMKTTQIFARMVPSHKLRIIKVLQENQEVVGMTGDGVNDAPSLKRANVGIAMGSRGTDVAREAADIVLLNDDFASIVAGIERGRVIFQNIKKAMSYIVSIHVPIAGLALVPVLMGGPLIFLPVHIVLLELLIDPACSLLFEAQSPDASVMKEKPRLLRTRLFTGKNLFRSTLQGLLVLGIAFVLWKTAIDRGDSSQTARTLSFLFLVFANVSLIFADLGAGSWPQLKKAIKMRSSQVVLAGLALVAVLVMQSEKVRDVLKLSRIPWSSFVIVLAGAFFVFFAVSVWNMLARRESTQHN